MHCWIRLARSILSQRLFHLNFWHVSDLPNDPHFRPVFLAGIQTCLQNACSSLCTCRCRSTHVLMFTTPIHIPCQQAFHLFHNFMLAFTRDLADSLNMLCSQLWMWLLAQHWLCCRQHEFQTPLLPQPRRASETKPKAKHALQDDLQGIH